MMVRKPRAGETASEFPDLEPKTEFARELLALRTRIAASGVALLDWEGVRRELAERRGGARINDE